jgi:hypothetical protein
MQCISYRPRTLHHPTHRHRLLRVETKQAHQKLTTRQTLKRLGLRMEILKVQRVQTAGKLQRQMFLNGCGRYIENRGFFLQHVVMV